MSDIQDLKDAIEAKGKAFHEHVKTLEAEVKQLSDRVVMGSETEEKLRKISADLASADAEKKDAEERLGKLEAAVKRGTVGVKGLDPELAAAQNEYKAEFKSWIAKGGDHMEAAHRKAFAADAEFKALAVQSDPDGGFVAPADMSGQTVTAMRETSPMRQIASQQTISTDALEGMVDNDEVTIEYVGETQTRNETTTAKLGKWRIPTHEIAARFYITQKLLDDAQFDVEAWMQAKVADKISRAQNGDFVNGDGVKTARGYITYPDSAPVNGVVPRGFLERVNTGAAGDLTNPDAIKGLINAQKQINRAGSTFQFSREGLFKVSLLRMDDQYVWQPGLQAGQPDRILGYQAYEFNDLPAFANGAIVGSFGEFRRGYQIVDRLQFRVLRDPYSNKPFVELYITNRFGGDVIDFDVIKLLEASA